MTKQERIERIYTDLKLADRLTPGRTPWQTLRNRAEEIASRVPLMDANSDNPLEASIARLRSE